MKHIKKIFENTPVMTQEEAVKIVNDKLKSLGFDVPLDKVTSVWGRGYGDKEKDAIKIEGLPAPMSGFMPGATIIIDPSFEPVYHDRYNPDPHIHIKINLRFRHAKRFDTKNKEYGNMQLFCSYYIAEGKWREDVLYLGDQAYT